MVATVTEPASGLNERRRGLKTLLKLAAAGAIDVVPVEFRDRLARFGLAYLVQALAAYGVRVEGTGHFWRLNSDAPALVARP